MPRVLVALLFLAPLACGPTTTGAVPLDESSAREDKQSKAEHQVSEPVEAPHHPFLDVDDGYPPGVDSKAASPGGDLDAPFPDKTPHRR